jgi:hypothetical protein
VTSAPPRASQTAACPAELPPPTTATREPPQSCASGGPGGVEDARPLVGGKVVAGEAAVLRTGRQQDDARGDLAVVLEAHEMAAVARLERKRAVRRRKPRAEFACLRDGAAGQLRPADARREPQIVLDPPRRPRLSTECVAVDDERVQPFGRAVDGCAQARGPATDHEQVDLLARPQLEADPERTRDLTSRRRAQFGAARQPDQRQAGRVKAFDGSRRRGIVGTLGVAPRERQPVGARPVEHLHRGLRSVRPDDLHADPLHTLKRLAPRDEGREHEIGERRVFEEKRPQGIAVYCDVAHRLDDDGRQEDGLPGEKGDLAEKLGRAVAGDLVAGGIDDRGLALEDGDERVRAVADAEQDVADICRPLLAELRERRELRCGEGRA